MGGVTMGNNKNEINDDLEENVSESIEKTKDKAEDFLKESSEEIIKKYEDMEEFIVNYIQKNPWKSLGISMLVGVLISSMIKR
jgi:ElaB/YqjD/DUF883 family membrane-anchored ribosome-binding protein